MYALWSRRSQRTPVTVRDALPLPTKLWCQVSPPRLVFVCLPGSTTIMADPQSFLRSLLRPNLHDHDSPVERGPVRLIGHSRDPTDQVSRETRRDACM